MAAHKHVLFHIDAEVFGMDITHVQGIEKYVNIVPVPNSQNFIEGMINLRNEIIPVFSLRAKFGMTQIEPTDETKLIIAKCHGMSIAFVIDSVKEIVELKDDEMFEPPKIINIEQTKYIKNVAAIQGHLVILLDLDGIISEAEKNSIQKEVTVKPEE